ncbi:unnamed protein product [Lasius platythorax]|uniref:Dynein heavy chain n=2 Tax=Lasius TaxID=488720 RepID=A0A0J7L595_LASNI|nr:dynein heavy chain [Lasius niger]
MWANNAHFGRADHDALHSVHYIPYTFSCGRRGYAPWIFPVDGGCFIATARLKDAEEHSWKFATCQVASSRATWELYLCPASGEVDIENGIPPSAEVWRQNLHAVNSDPEVLSENVIISLVRGKKHCIT